MLEKVESAWFIVKRGHFKTMFDLISTRMYSSNSSICISRKPKIDFEAPKAKIDYDIRVFKKSDLKDMGDVYKQVRFFKQDISHCYVGITKDNQHCFRIWLMKSSENDKIQNYWGDFLPLLKPNEAMIEGAYANEEYRGLRIMPSFLDRLCTMMDSDEIDRIIGVVDLDNVISVKGLIRSGFEPYQSRKVKWRFFKRTVIFGPLSDEVLKKFEQIKKDVL